VRAGTCRAPAPGMAITSYRDLEAWRLADELRRRIIAITARSPARVDGRFCSGIRDAAGSVCRNLAEGFERYHHRQFAFFVRVALGSLGETDDQLEEACQRGYLSAAELAELRRLGQRVRLTLKGLLKHLTRPPHWRGPPRSATLALTFHL